MCMMSIYVYDEYLSILQSPQLIPGETSKNGNVCWKWMSKIGQFTLHVEILDS